jgi:hypothetical protein
VPVRRLRTLLLIAAVASSGVSIAGTPGTPLHIGHITIDAVSVYSEAEVTHGRFYRLVNLLHVQTRTELLRRFLLFHEGDPYDPAKLAETERNLRNFDFLESASVTASLPHDGLVDVAVVTHDALTTDINADFSNDGGIAAYSVDVTQKDLFGTGSSLDLHTEHGIERNANTIELMHPAALGPYWNLDTLYSNNSDGNEEKFDLERPLFSYTTPWTASLLFDRLLRNERIFAQGEVAARFRQGHRQLAISRSKVLHADQNGSSSIVAGLDLLDDSFSHLPERPLDIIPVGRHFRFLDGGYEWTGFRFVKLDFVDRDLREQDFNLGRFTSLHAAISPPSSGSRSMTVRLRASEGIGYAFSDHSFVIGQISASTRAPNDRNTLIALDGRSVTRFQTRYPQAFVTRIRLDLGWQLDRDVQFLADGQSGLRAYPDFAFEGSRRLIVNAEHRLFLGRELLQVFGPGIAVFADSGQAVNGPFRGMKSDIGVGLRIGIARIDSALIRIDWAYALNASPLNHRGPVWSISTMQAF